MDDLVVIILTLIVAGAGILGQIKKKKQMPAPPDAQKSPESFWDLFREEAFAPDSLANSGYYDVEEKAPELNTTEQQYNFEPKNEGGYLKTNKPDIQPVENKTGTKKKDKFNLRKAVIYSEILNRKYI